MMPFYCLTYYCRSRTAEDTVKIHKILANAGNHNNNFGIQGPMGIKNVIKLDK
jgi:hypothetical protein